MQEYPLVGQLLDLIENHGLALVGLIILIMWLKPKAEQVWNKAWGIKDREEPVQTLLRADLEVTALLQEALVALSAHWATIWQFHNGTVSLAGVPFLKLSATHEVTDSKHGAVAYLFQNLSTSLFSDNTMRMYRENVVVMDADDVGVNSAIRNAMKTYNFGRSYMAGINDSRGRLVGAITISYDDHRELTEEQYKQIQTYSERAALLLEISARDNLALEKGK
jgi:hypothetical protein